MVGVLGLGLRAVDRVVGAELPQLWDGGMLPDEVRGGPMLKPLNVLTVLVTLAAMVGCGVVACVTTATSLMNLGLALHNNYEYYGSSLALALVLVAGAIGFLAPGIIVWKLHNKELPFRFSFRTLLIATTLVAVVLGLIVWLR